MIFNPPEYQWEATTVYDAEKALRAALKLIEAHIDTLVPDANDAWDVKRATPIRLKVDLDLSGLVERINDLRTVDAMAAEFDERN